MLGQKELMIAALTLTVIGGVFASGFYKGTTSQKEKFEDDRQKLQTELLDLSDDIRTKNDEILRLNAEKAGLIYDLENQAYAAEGSSNLGVSSTGGLQRLEERWGPSPKSP